MRRIALLAPGVWEPLTEGRKLFVTDLAGQLRASGLEVEVFTGDRDANGVKAILQSLRSLRQRCDQGPALDGVVVFPYGTFTGLRRWANAWLLRAAAWTGRRRGMPTLPLFYSCAGISLEQIDRHYGPCLAVGVSRGSVSQVDLAISRQIVPWQARHDSPRQLLFLCGYQTPTAAALDGVLHERGLMDLLQAGNALADAGLALTIAIPFLRDPGMQDSMRKLLVQHCPRLAVTLMESVDAAEVFNAFDAFVFPYRANHAVFVPTSLLEAMTAGIPVVAADLPMYRSLTLGAEGPRCSLYEAGDVQGLVRSILDMQQDYPACVAMADRSARRLREPGGMARSATTVLAHLRTRARAR